MKILHINTERTWRGGEQQTLYLAEGLHKKGVATGVVCQPGVEMEARARAAGVPVYPIKMRGEWDLRAVLKIRSLILREKFDIVHMHTSHAHTLGVLAARLGGRAKTVVSRRVDFSIFRHRFSMSGIKYKFGVDRYIAISRAIRDQMVKDGILEEKIRVVHSGIDLTRFEGKDGSYVRESLGLGEEDYFAAVVAHFGWHKGHKYMVDAAPMIRKEVPNFKVVFVGTGDLEGEIRERVKARGAEDCVVFAGFREDVPEVLAALDLFIMPSVMEGLCTSILDALASGRPVVACEAGGMPEIIEHGRTGFLAQPGDAGSLAEMVVGMVKGREKAMEMAEAGRAKVIEGFSVGAMVSGCFGVYEGLLG